MPTRPMYSNTSTAVTDKQRSFIEKLLAEKDTTGTAYEGWTPDWAAASKGAATSVISYLLTLPRRTAPAASSAEPEAGVYRGDGRVFRVYHGQNSGHMLVKEVVFSAEGPAGDGTGSVSYAYLGSARRELPSSAVRLSLEEVGSLGKSWDSCLICGRRLDDPESVDRGIGPICAAKYDA